MMPFTDSVTKKNQCQIQAEKRAPTVLVTLVTYAN